MADYCKKCRKEIAPSLLDMIEAFRDRLWEIEEKKPFKAVHYNDPDYDCFGQDDQQLFDAINDKMNALENYYEACKYKLDIVYRQMNRMEDEAE